MSDRMQAEVRGRARGALTDGVVTGVRMSPDGALLVAQSLPPLSEMSRLGKSWWVKNTTAAAALVAMPTTTSGLTIFNPASNRECLIIDSAGAVEIVPDATQQNSGVLWAACGRAFTAPAAGTVAFGSMSGIKTYNGPVVATEAGTTVVADSPWQPIASVAPANTQVTGSDFRHTEVDLLGKYIVVPGGAFHIAMSKKVATASQLFYLIRWHEAELQYV